jgi:hypothetical protein
MTATNMDVCRSGETTAAAVAARIPCPLKVRK